jgi:magnesium-transporting ATPase (P-type)
MNAILLAVSAVIKILHIFFNDSARAQWFILVFGRNLIIVVMAYILWKMAEFFNGRIKKYGKEDFQQTADLLKLNFQFWLISMCFSNFDLVLSLLRIQYNWVFMTAELVPMVWLICKIIIKIREGKNGRP